jgi:hypothetical protein
VVSGVLRDLIRQTGPSTVVEASGPAIGGLVPGLAGGSAGEQTRGEVFDAFTMMVEALARQRMLWLVFEDVHWADGSSRGLIDYLVRTVGPCQLLASCTRRTHDEPPTRQLQRFVAELVRHPRTERLTLGRLSTEAVAACRDAVPLTGRPELNPTLWFDAVGTLVGPLFALGEWDEADQWLQAAADLKPTGRWAGLLKIGGAGLCCARGDSTPRNGRCTQPRPTCSM